MTVPEWAITVGERESSLPEGVIEDTELNSIGSRCPDCEIDPVSRRVGAEMAREGRFHLATISFTSRIEP
jgi:hypothetical protein